MKQFAKISVMAVIFLAASVCAQAQDQGLPCDGTDIDLECPIDGGVAILMAAGALFGFKKLAIK